MGKGRLEAFSDGVIAIIITIMVLELRPPPTADPAGLLKLIPVLSAYVFSFLVVAIMWVNHHALITLVKHVDAGILWANNNLLFWLSLIPFVTAYIGPHHTAPAAVALYGGVLAGAASAFTILRFLAARQDRHNSRHAEIHRRAHRKNLLGLTLYSASAPLAYLSVYVSLGIFVLIPMLYFLPERVLFDEER